MLGPYHQLYHGSTRLFKKTFLPYLIVVTILFVVGQIGTFMALSSFSIGSMMLTLISSVLLVAASVWALVLLIFNGRTYNRKLYEQVQGRAEDIPTRLKPALILLVGYAAAMILVSALISVIGGKMVSNAWMENLPSDYDAAQADSSRFTESSDDRTGDSNGNEAGSGSPWLLAEDENFWDGAWENTTTGDVTTFAGFAIGTFYFEDGHIDENGNYVVYLMAPGENGDEMQAQLLVSSDGTSLIYYIASNAGGLIASDEFKRPTAARNDSLPSELWGNYIYDSGPERNGTLTVDAFRIDDNTYFNARQENGVWVVETGNGIEGWNERLSLLPDGRLSMPLNDLLEAYGPDILAGVSEDSWGAVTGTDGNIYGLPVRYPYSKEVSCFILCRMDLMREAGVDEVPTTIDEFYEALVKIKEHFGDEYIPFAGPLINVGASNGTGGLQAFAISGSIASAFGIYNDWMVNDDGEVIYMTEAPGYADMVTFMNKLYTEGLLDPDYAVNTNTTLREKFSGEKAVMICANRGTVTSVTALMENNPDITWDDIGYIYALESASGEATYMQMDYLSNITAILRTSENAADCINFVNEKVKNQEYLTIGSEGVEWEKDEEGLYVPIQPAFTDNRTRADRYLDALDEEAYSYQWMARVRKSESNWYPFTHCALEAQEKRPYVFHESEFGLMPPSENYSKYQASQFESLTDFTMQLIFGTKTLENDLATFENDWKNNGGEEVRAELQAYIDSKQ